MEIINNLSFSALDDSSGISFNEVEKLIRNVPGKNQAVQVSQAPSTGPRLGQVPVLDQPDMGLVDLTTALLEAQSKLEQEQLGFTKNDIEATSIKNEAAHKERISSLEESIKEMEKAQKGGLFGKIFGWIATIATCIAAVATAVVTGGAAAAPLMVAAGLMLAQQISSECGTSLTEFIAKALEPIMGEQAAQWVADIAFAVAVIALTLGAGAGAAANTASKAVKIATQIGQAARVTGGVSTVAQGASQGVATEANYQATMYQADAKEIAAFIAKMQAMMSENTDRVQELLLSIQNCTSKVMAIMNSSHSTGQSISQNILA